MNPAWLLTIGWLTVTCAMAAAPKPDFALLRQEEDYSSLANTARSGWSRIKLVPVKSDETAWLSFGGEVRVRYENFRNENWSDGLNDPDGYLLTRAYVHTDLHVDSFRFFGQVQHSLSHGRRGGPGPVDEDRLDAQQAFVSWEGHKGDVLGSAKVRLGRQEVQFGSGRIVAARAGANTRQAFDGALIRTHGGDTRVDLFWLACVRTGRLEFDNRREPGRYIMGAYTTLGKLPVFENVDVYALFSREPNREYVGIVGRERRGSVGLRPWGRSGAWDYNLEFVGQFGDFSGESIRAWTVASDVGFTVAAAAWSLGLA